jgi:hypothetical protein
VFVKVGRHRQRQQGGRHVRRRERRSLFLRVEEDRPVLVVFVLLLLGELYRGQCRVRYIETYRKEEKKEKESVNVIYLDG